MYLNLAGVSVTLTFAQGFALYALLWHSALSLKVYYKTRTAPFPHSKRPPFLTSPRPKQVINPLSLLSCTITERSFPLVSISYFLKACCKRSSSLKRIPPACLPSTVYRRLLQPAPYPHHPHLALLQLGLLQSPHVTETVSATTAAA